MFIEKGKIMDKYIEKIAKMSQGNIGALTVLETLVTNELLGIFDGQYIGILDSYKIYGSDIWQLYKDCCHEDIEFMKVILEKLPPENIKYHINHGKRGIEYNKNLRNGNVDDWIIVALTDLKEYNIYARMEIDNFGIYPSQIQDITRCSYCIWVRIKNKKKICFNHTIEQITNTGLNIFISYILKEIENFCKHYSLRDAMKLEDVIDYLRGIADGWKPTNAEYINGSFLDTCCKDHLQLMEWLMELKQYKLKYGDLEYGN